MADILRISDGVEEISLDLLKDLVAKWDAQVSDRFEPLHAAYVNNYAIFSKAPKDPTVVINAPDGQKRGEKPDHRVAANFAAYIVDTFEGFFLGNAIKTTSSEEAVAEYVNYLDAYNDQDDGNAELSRLVSIYGRAYELYYTDEEGVECIAHLSPMDAFAVYDEGLKPRMRYFVRVYTDVNDVRKGSISDGNAVRYFSYEDGLHWTTEPDPHGFDTVPAVEFVQNEARRGIFENVLNLIDEFNEVLSEKSNDIDAFADAILAVYGIKLEDEDLVKVRNRRVINLYGQLTGAEKAEFLGRPNADASQEHQLDRLMDLIFTISMVLNVQDDKFTSTSGTALKLKMNNMSNLFKSKERKFVSGLNRRYRILFSNPVARMSEDAWTTLKYTFTPNVPLDIEGEASAVSTLTGIVSRKTQLKILSSVDDVDAELTQIAKEQDGEGYDTDYPTERTGGDAT